MLFVRHFQEKMSENLFKIISIVLRYEQILRLPSLRSNERTDVRSVGSCINLIPVTCFGRKQLPTVKQKADEKPKCNFFISWHDVILEQILGNTTTITLLSLPHTFTFVKGIHRRCPRHSSHVCD